MIDDVQMRRDSYPTASVLFGVAALQCLTGLLGLFVRLTNPDIDMPELRWFLYSFQRGDSTWLDWVTLSTVGLYLVLGFGAYAFRVPAALLAFASYCAFLFIGDRGIFTEAVVVKLPIICLLAVSVMLAFRRP